MANPEEIKNNASLASQMNKLVKLVFAQLFHSVSKKI
jgi:hypothetical protein